MRLIVQECVIRDLSPGPVAQCVTVEEDGARCCVLFRRSRGVGRERKEGNAVAAGRLDLLRGEEKTDQSSFKEKIFGDSVKIEKNNLSLDRIA